MSGFMSKVFKGFRNPSQGSRYVLSRLKGDWYRTKYVISRKRFQCGSNFRVRDKFDVSGPGSVRIGDNVLIEGGPFNINSLYTFSPEAEISIGAHCYLNGVRVSCRTKVDIGNWCIFADARITDTDQHSVFPNRWDPGVRIESEPVVIEDNVWVCLAALILKGVRIGRNSVVAAGAVVSRDVPENCVVAGNPAQIVKTFSEDEVRLAEEFFGRRVGENRWGRVPAAK